MPGCRQYLYTCRHLSLGANPSLSTGSNPRSSNCITSMQSHQSTMTKQNQITGSLENDQDMSAHSRTTSQEKLQSSSHCWSKLVWSGHVVSKTLAASGAQNNQHTPAGRMNSSRDLCTCVDTPSALVWAPPAPCTPIPTCKYTHTRHSPPCSARRQRAGAAAWRHRNASGHLDNASDRHHHPLLLSITHYWRPPPAATAVAAAAAAAAMTLARCASHRQRKQWLPVQPH